MDEKNAQILTEEEYKKLNKRKPKNKLKERDEFGDPANINEYKGPWAKYKDSKEAKITNLEKKEQLGLNRITNKYCLEKNKEKFRLEQHFKMEKFYSTKEKFLVKNFNSKSDVLYSHNHRDLISKVYLFNSYDLLLSSSYDGKVNLIGMKGKAGLLGTFMGHSKGISYFILSSDESVLYTASFDENLKVWDIERGKCKNSYKLFSPILCCEKEKTDRLIYFGCNNGVVNFLDLRSNKIEKIVEISGGDEKTDKGTILLNRKAPSQIVLSDDCNVMGLTSKTGFLQFFDLRNNEQIKSYDTKYYSVQYHNDIFFTQSENYIDKISTSNFEIIEHRINCADVSSSIFISSSGNYLYYGTNSGKTTLINTKDLSSESIGGPSEPITAVHWNESYELSMVTGDFLGNIRVYN